MTPSQWTASADAQRAGELLVALPVAAAGDQQIPSGRAASARIAGSRPLRSHSLPTNAATRRPGAIPSFSRSAARLGARDARRKGLGVDAVVDRHHPLGAPREVLAHLLGDALGDADERRRAVQPEADRSQTLVQRGDQPRCRGAYSRRRPARGRRPGLVAVVDGDRVDAVEHDRAGRLHDPAPAPAHGERARRAGTRGRRSGTGGPARAPGGSARPTPAGSSQTRPMTVTW